MSDSIRLPQGRRDDYISMPSKYDTLEFKTIPGINQYNAK